MCAVSMIADHYNDRLQRNYPDYWRWEQPEITSGVVTLPPGPSRYEFDALKAEVENLRELLVKAKAYDARTGQPDCEKAEKVAALRQIAKLVGVDLADVLG